MGREWSGEWRKEVKDKVRMRKRKGSRVERWEERLAEVINDKTKKEGEGGGQGPDVERRFLRSQEK